MQLQGGLEFQITPVTLLQWGLALPELQLTPGGFTNKAEVKRVPHRERHQFLGNLIETKTTELRLVIAEGFSAPMTGFLAQ